MKSITSLIFVIIILASCSKQGDPAPVNPEVLQDPVESVDPPVNAMASLMGVFSSYAHSLAGNAVVYTDEQGNRTLRLENYTMTEGPDVYVFLSKTNNYSQANTIGISKLKNSFNDSALHLSVDPQIDLHTHKFVLIYCVQYNSLFGYAELK